MVNGNCIEARNKHNSKHATNLVVIMPKLMLVGLFARASKFMLANSKLGLEIANQLLELQVVNSKILFE